jgi:hypothetical protein
MQTDGNLNIRASGGQAAMSDGCERAVACRALPLPKSVGGGNLGLDKFISGECRSEKARR